MSLGREKLGKITGSQCMFKVYNARFAIAAEGS